MLPSGNVFVLYAELFDFLNVNISKHNAISTILI